MKILCDTSYFLPLIKISIEEIPDNLLLELLSESKHEYYYSELSVFEIAAKGLKFLINETEITLQDVMSGLDALQNDSRLKSLSWSDNPLIIELASKFRAIHQDTIDCFIFASAICNCDCILTMDLTFYEKIANDKFMLKEINALNDKFQFWFGDISKDPVSL